MKRSNTNPLLIGFSFGLILLVAIGPISLNIFSTAATKGFLNAIADALFIF